jgi:malonyl-CoA O-methyltransferase
MKKNGLFIFSTLGPDSLLALKKAWAEIDSFSHINNYIDMHIIGDQLMNAGLLDPVLDSERMIIKYNDTSSLERDLTHTGARNALSAREGALTGRKKYEEFRRKLFPSNSTEKLNIEMEIIYGHAWGREPSPSENEHIIDASNITRRKINT